MALADEIRNVLKDPMNLPAEFKDFLIQHQALNPVPQTAVISPILTSTGLTGSTQPSRYVGSTTSGAPTSGSFQVGDFVIDHSGAVWICVTAGSPGTWHSTADKNSTSAQVFSGGVQSAHPTEGIGYSSGSGGTLSIAYASLPGTINKTSGAITVTGVPAISSLGSVALQFANSTVSATDNVVVTQSEAGFCIVPAALSGHFYINIFNPSSTTIPSLTYAFQFTVWKGVAS